MLNSECETKSGMYYMLTIAHCYLCHSESPTCHGREYKTEVVGHLFPELILILSSLSLSSKDGSQDNLALCPASHLGLALIYVKILQIQSLGF